ncbi:hypothetical protein [Microseira sp. BLCC-F43]|jgi:hypothetical protein|uniref:hypothetical protein n=1 Tax=Microseira sp. BLCC-F43 TaxID=3153602 RepID=UPI0035BA4E2F
MELQIGSEILSSLGFSLFQNEENQFLIRKNALGETCYIVCLNTLTQELWEELQGKQE